MLEVHYGWIAFFMFLAITVLIATKMPVAIVFLSIGVFGFTFMLGKPVLNEARPHDLGHARQLPPDLGRPVHPDGGIHDAGRPESASSTTPSRSGSTVFPAVWRR